MLDLLIRNGRVYDGTGNPWFPADVGVAGGRVEAVGRLGEAEAARVIDTGGRAVCPGFIDMHSHSDFTLGANPRAESKVRQGVTTEVIGNCGLTPAPVNPATLPLLRRYLAFMGEGLAWDWHTLGQFLERLAAGGLALNVAQLVGHGTLRLAVMGYDRRAPTADELAAMQDLLRQALDDGAFGLSSGLIYTPGAYAETEELIALARVAAERGAFYASHIRGEAETLVAAVDEAIRIGREGRLPVEISHHKAIGRENWGRVNETLGMIERARAEGVEVTCDQYPYTGSSTTLAATAPTWALEGGVERLQERLGQPELRQRMRREMKGEAAADCFMRAFTPDQVVIATCNAAPELQGLTLAQVAERRGDADPYDTMLDLLRQHGGGIGAIFHGLCDEDVDTVLRHPTTMIGSDGSALAREGPVSRGRPHPRSYGTFPRVLGQYARDRRVISLEDAIRKMTSLPAQKLGLKDRGLLRAGYAADVVVFDPATVRDTATWEEPHRYPEGIDWVVVNGRVVIDQGRHTGTLPGGVLTPGGRS